MKQGTLTTESARQVEKAALTISLEELEEDALASEQKREECAPKRSGASKPKSKSVFSKVFRSKRSKKKGEPEDGTEMVEKHGEHSQDQGLTLPHQLLSLLMVGPCTCGSNYSSSVTSDFSFMSIIFWQRVEEAMERRRA